MQNPWRGVAGTFLFTGTHFGLGGVGGQKSTRWATNISCHYKTDSVKPGRLQAAEKWVPLISLL